MQSHNIANTVDSCFIELYIVSTSGQIHIIVLFDSENSNIVL